MFFITGGTGFLGAYIIKELIDKGIQVRAIRRSAYLPFFISTGVLDKVEWIEGDILDVYSLNEGMQGVDTVIHAAAMVSFSPGNRKQMYQVNVEGTANVVNIALENKIRRIVHISSVAALGRTTKAETISEENKWEENKNNTHYAITKHQAEMHVWRGFAEGLEGVIINPSTILGYGNWDQSSSAIFKNIYKGFPWYTKGINGFVGVEDVANATVKLALSDSNQKRFIINAQNCSFQQLFNTIADHFKKDRPSREATIIMSEITWRLEKIRSIFSGKVPLLTRETSKVAHSNTSFDNGSLLSEFPHFQFTPLEKVIKDSCQKYLDALHNGIISL